MINAPSPSRGPPHQAHRSDPISDEGMPEDGAMDAFGFSAWMLNDMNVSSQQALHDKPQNHLTNARHASGSLEAETDDVFSLPFGVHDGDDALPFPFGFAASLDEALPLSANPTTVHTERRSGHAEEEEAASPLMASRGHSNEEKEAADHFFFFAGVEEEEEEGEAEERKPMEDMPRGPTRLGAAGGGGASTAHLFASASLERSAERMETIPFRASSSDSRPRATALEATAPFHEEVEISQSTGRSSGSRKHLKESNAPPASSSEPPRQSAVPSDGHTGGVLPSSLQSTGKNSSSSVKASSASKTFLFRDVTNAHSEASPPESARHTLRTHGEEQRAPTSSLHMPTAAGLPSLKPRSQTTTKNVPHRSASQKPPHRSPHALPSTVANTRTQKAPLPTLQTPSQNLTHVGGDLPASVYGSVTSATPKTATLLPGGASTSQAGAADDTALLHEAHALLQALEVQRRTLSYSSQALASENGTVKTGGKEGNARLTGASKRSTHNQNFTVVAKSLLHRVETGGNDALKTVSEVSAAMTEVLMDMLSEVPDSLAQLLAASESATTFSPSGLSLQEEEEIFSGEEHSDLEADPRGPIRSKEDKGETHRGASEHRKHTRHRCRPTNLLTAEERSQLAERYRTMSFTRLLPLMTMELERLVNDDEEEEAEEEDQGGRDEEPSRRSQHGLSNRGTENKGKQVSRTGKEVRRTEPSQMLNNKASNSPLSTTRCCATAPANESSPLLPEGSATIAPKSDNATTVEPQQQQPQPQQLRSTSPPPTSALHATKATAPMTHAPSSSTKQGNATPGRANTSTFRPSLGTLHQPQQKP